MTAPRHAAQADESFTSYAEFYRASAYSKFAHQQRGGGSFGISIFKAEQPPIDFIDAPVPELIFCRGDTLAGEVLIDSGDKPTISKNVDTGLIVYPANTATRTRATGDHALTQLAIPIDCLSPEMGKAGIDADGCVFSGWLSRQCAMPVSASRLLDRMWAVLEAPTRVDHLLFDGLTLQFLAEMAGASDLSPFGRGRPEDERIARVIDYIEAHYGEALTVSELADVACLSPAHFSRVFKATVGAPVWAHVQQRRCVRAKEMLTDTRLPLIEIAFRCGFSGQAHFTRAISRQFGVTPASIRRGVSQ